MTRMQRRTMRMQTLWISIVGVLAVTIYAALAAVQILVLNPLAAAARPLIPAMGFLVLLTLGAGGYFIASFGAGMGLADAFGIGGGDYSPWARPLYAASALSAVALVVVGVMAAVRPRSAPAAA
ncbi:hypothetical protein [Microbacterium sp. UCD-TDU]|uniref:hypothetical protein n=1 Tax=Microbacterium sp. UCD-TDU TaxID=1247714 RepID=UPI001F4911F0|nr:hypothetical protein [Microbacterium sp. UCD-TDU]